MRALTAEPLAGRVQALERLARGTLLRRAGHWFGTCLLCPMFWAVLAACGLFADLGSGARWAVVTAFCQAGLGVAISARLVREGREAPAGPGAGKSQHCPSCAK